VKTKRLAKRWILGWAAALGLVAIPSKAAGQITITAKDFFGKEGQYYKVYSNMVRHYSGVEASEEVDAFDFIGEAGEDQVWDFREGPEDEVIQFDYVKPEDVGPEVDIDGVTIAERATYETTGRQSSLFLDLNTARGRNVFGLHAERLDKVNPIIPFSTRLNDFPALIKYEDSWESSTTYEFIAREKVEGVGEAEIPSKYVYRSSMEVDGHGIIMLPELGFHDCLRINELVQYDVFVNIEGITEDWFKVATKYVRNYYWLAKDMGIVAQISSGQQDVPPPAEFSVADALWRQFENNHGKSTETAQPVEGLELSLDPNKKRILLSWKKAENTVEYLVQYSDTLGADSWRELKKTTGNFVLDDISSEKHRFYRIVSLE
tara:strand:- start:979 stop:2106 length:1128 start_codon:yes stop_codon:yes gene_type:complete